MPTTDDLRTGVGAVATLAIAALHDLWQQVLDAMRAKEVLAELLPPLIDSYGSAAATFAADWYDDYRDQSEVHGLFTATPVEIGDRGALELAGWAVGPLFGAEPDWETAVTLVDGGLQRRIADVARDTIITSSLADPASDGWQRVGDGSCAFCQMLIARGAVYSEANVDFASHDWCNCGVAPAFGGKVRPVKPYTPTSRNITDADRARVRKYLRTH